MTDRTTPSLPTPRPRSNAEPNRTGYDLALQKPHLFWRHVQLSPGCWEWRGALNAYGYGVLSRFDGPHRFQIMAHRVGYELVSGPIPEGLVLDHLCRNTKCVRAEHLEPVTSRVNILRGVGASAIQARRTHCVNGHPFTDKRAKRGERVCSECLRIKNARYYATESERLGRNRHNRYKTHCLRGHPLNGPDIHIDKRGRRQCRACERERYRSAAR